MLNGGITEEDIEEQRKALLISGIAEDIEETLENGGKCCYFTEWREIWRKQRKVLLISGIAEDMEETLEKDGKCC